MTLTGFKADNDNIKRKKVGHFLYFSVLRVNNLY